MKGGKNMPFDEYAIKKIRPSFKKHISDKRRSRVLSLVSFSFLFIGIPLICIIVHFIEIFSILASVVVLVMGVVTIVESSYIFGLMSMGSSEKLTNPSFIIYFLP